MNLREWMEREIFKKAKYVKYIDFDKNILSENKCFKSSHVLYFEELDDGGLLLQLWIHNNIPEGWKIRKMALTAPRGFCWIYNGKSVFDEKYISVLMRTQ